jgi:hypothetical protein
MFTVYTVRVQITRCYPPHDPSTNYPVWVGGFLTPFQPHNVFKLPGGGSSDEAASSDGDGSSDCDGGSDGSGDDDNSDSSEDEGGLVGQ